MRKHDHLLLGRLSERKRQLEQDIALLSTTKHALERDVSTLEDEKSIIIQGEEEEEESQQQRLAAARQAFEQDQQDAKTYLRDMAMQLRTFHVPLTAWRGEMVEWRRDLLVIGERGSSGEEEDGGRRDDNELRGGGAAQTRSDGQMRWAER